MRGPILLRGLDQLTSIWIWTLMSSFQILTQLRDHFRRVILLFCSWYGWCCLSFVLLPLTNVKNYVISVLTPSVPSYSDLFSCQEHGNSAVYYKSSTTARELEVPLWHGRRQTLSCTSIHHNLWWRHLCDSSVCFGNLEFKVFASLCGFCTQEMYCWSCESPGILAKFTTWGPFLALPEGLSGFLRPTNKRRYSAFCNEFEYTLEGFSLVLLSGNQRPNMPSRTTNTPKLSFLWSILHWRRHHNRFFNF